MADSIHIRPASAEDKKEIVSFCQNTFSWGDYIGEVWDEWIADANGTLLVAVVDDQPAGLLHVAHLGDGTAWMEGMRVHPDLRRHGVGSALDAQGRTWARAKGCHAARLATSVHNLPAQRALPTQGYHQISAFGGWVAPSLDQATRNLRLASAGDVQEVLAIWRESRAYAVGARLVQDPRWRWTELTLERLREHVRAAQVRVSGKGFTIASTFDAGDSPEFNIHAVIGDKETVRELALDLRREAAYRGYERLKAMVADDEASGGGLSEAGFVREGGMLIYEQPL